MGTKSASIVKFKVTFFMKFQCTSALHILRHSHEDLYYYLIFPFLPWLYILHK